MLRSSLMILITVPMLLLSGCSDSSDGNKDGGADLKRASDMRRIEGPTTGKIHDLAPMPDWAPLQDQTPQGQDSRPD